MLLQAAVNTTREKRSMLELQALLLWKRLSKTPKRSNGFPLMRMALAFDLAIQEIMDTESPMSHGTGFTVQALDANLEKETLINLPAYPDPNERSYTADCKGDHDIAKPRPCRPAQIATQNSGSEYAEVFHFPR